MEIKALVNNLVGERKLGKLCTIRHLHLDFSLQKFLLLGGGGGEGKGLSTHPITSNGPSL